MPNKETKKLLAQIKQKEKEEERQADLRRASDTSRSYIGKEWSVLISKFEIPTSPIAQKLGIKSAEVFSRVITKDDVEILHDFLSERIYGTKQRLKATKAKSVSVAKTRKKAKPKKGSKIYDAIAKFGVGKLIYTKPKS